jgi:hypothetical protein
LVEFIDLDGVEFAVSEARILDKIVLRTFGLIGFFLLHLDLLEEVSVNGVEAIGIVVEAIETFLAEVLFYGNVAETSLFDFLRVQFVFSRKNLLSMVVVPSPFVRVRQALVSLVYLLEFLLRVFTFVLIRVEN